MRTRHGFRHLAGCLGASSILLLCVPGKAQAPQSLESRAATATLGNQGESAVAKAADGSFVVVWASYYNPGNSGIFAQRFDRFGVRQGGEVAVNDTTADSPRWPDVALQPTGFVVTWSQVIFGGGATGDVRARLFAADGTPRGTDFLVNSHTTGAQWRSRVAAGADGSFVVVWEDGFGVESGQDGSGVGVRAQRFGAAGAPRGGEIAVNAFTTGFQRYPDVAAGADGRFVVTWESQEQDGSGIGIFGRRFAANGAAQGGDFQVNTATVGYQTLPAVAAESDGTFVVAWSGYAAPHETNGADIRLQRLSPTGEKLGPELTANSELAEIQSAPAVAVTASGAFAVAWDSRNGDGDGLSTAVRSFDPDGTPAGAEVRVNLTTAGDQRSPALAFDPSGDLVVSWTSTPRLGATGQDGDGAGTFLRRFTTPCVPSDAALCLLAGRFKVAATWHEPTRGSGGGRAVALSSDTGYFWFFDAANVELVVKVLDGCGLNDHVWVFAGGLTDLAVDLTVTDTATGATAVYENPPQTPFAPIQDTAALASCD